MYQIAYRRRAEPDLQDLATDVFDRHVWQPTLEFFLPVQMCHMRVEEKYRVWHGLDHVDDALDGPGQSESF